jgi:hypothetical protein
MASAQPLKHRHSCGVRAGHLDDESALDLSLRLCALDEYQAGVHSSFGDPAARQPSGRNELLERGVDEGAR